MANFKRGKPHKHKLHPMHVYEKGYNDTKEEKIPQDGQNTPAPTKRPKVKKRFKLEWRYANHRYGQDWQEWKSYETLEQATTAKAQLEKKNTGRLIHEYRLIDKDKDAANDKLD